MTTIILEGYGEVEVTASVPLNYNIQNLLDINQTPSSFSKNITLVGTKNNNLVLGHAFDVNITNPSFNVNKKVRCIVSQDGTNVFQDAYFQLLSVDKDKDGRITYTARVKSDLMSFFTDIKGKELTDLRLQEGTMEHTLDWDVVEGSFDNDADDRYKYILHYTTTTENVVHITDFKPAIYAKTFWDKIHDEAGWVYRFEGMEDMRFDKLLIPNSTKYSPSEELIHLHKFIAQKVPEAYLGFSPNFPNYAAAGRFGFTTNEFPKKYNIPASAVVQDLNGTWIPEDQLYKSVYVGHHIVKIDLDYKWTITFNNPAQMVTVGSIVHGLRTSFYFKIQTSSGQTVSWSPNSNSLDVFFPTGQTFGAGIHEVSTGKATFTIPVYLSLGEAITSIEIVYYHVQAGQNGANLQLLPPGAGAQFKRVSDLTVNEPYNPKLDITYSNFEIIPQLNYDFGVPINLDDFVPKGIKQRDFIKSIIDMYKLLVYPDPHNPNVLVYTPRDWYYDKARFVDWSDKLDRDRTITLDWLQDKQAKKIILTYKEDKDVANDAYTSATKEIYGEYTYRMENEYNVGEDKTELVFSPTPFFFNNTIRAYLPMIDAEEDYNIRLLYDGGKRTDGKFRTKLADGTISAEKTDYPLAIHMDNPENPTFDLNFGQCAFYMVSNFEPTMNNLFTLFHRRYIGQLTNGRLMTAYFKLSPYDIHDFRLSDKIHIDDTLWNVNRIIDYDANSGGVTKVELVTVDDGTNVRPPWKRKIKLSGGAVDHRMDLMVGEMNGMNVRRKNTILAGSLADVKGTGNIVAGSSGVVYGDNNVVEAPGAVVIGNNNTVNGAKLVVGENITIDDTSADIVAGKVQAKESIGVGNIQVTDNGVGYYEEDAEGVPQMTSGIQFDDVEGDVVIPITPNPYSQLNVGQPVVYNEGTQKLHYTPRGVAVVNLSTPSGLTTVFSGFAPGVYEDFEYISNNWVLGIFTGYALGEGLTVDSPPNNYYPNITVDNGPYASGLDYNHYFKFHISMQIETYDGEFGMYNVGVGMSDGDVNGAGLVVSPDNSFELAVTENGASTTISHSGILVMPSTSDSNLIRVGVANSIHQTTIAPAVYIRKFNMIVEHLHSEVI